jgi:hypothetical protein
MTNSPKTTIRPEHARVVATMLVLALAALSLLVAPVAAQDGSPEPTASLTPVEAACASADDLQVIVDFLGESVGSEAGLLPVGIGVIAGLSEARTLVGLVAEVYRPLVQDLIVALQDLRDTLGELDELDTAGTKVSAVGEAVVDIGNSMDELGMQLRTGCPEE